MKNNKLLEILRNKYNNEKIPIIINKASCSKLNELSKNKYIVDKTLLMMQFKNTIVSKLKLDSTQTIFIYYDNYILDLNKTCGEQHNKFKNDDYILYLTYCEENVFG